VPVLSNGPLKIAPRDAPGIFPNPEARLDGSGTQQRIALHDLPQTCERSHFPEGLKRKKSTAVRRHDVAPDGD
jgi:hypothetical protein